MSDGYKYLFVGMGLIVLLFIGGAPGVALLFLGVGLIFALLYFFGALGLIGLGLAASKLKEKEDADKIEEPSDASTESTET